MGRATFVHLPRLLAVTISYVLCLVIEAGQAYAMPIGGGPIPYRLRAPQVHVNGSGLQVFLNDIGDNINVQTAQADAELIRSAGSNNSTFTVQLELVALTPGSTFGLYNGHEVPGTLMRMFPEGAGRGWFAVASFRSSPLRVVISLFDNTAAFKGNTTTLGGDRSGIGFYLATAHATYFSQDALNPGNAPRALFYPGTGLDTGSMWLAWEDGDSPADADFDDCIVFIEAGSSIVTAAQHSTWGALKSRFR